MLWRRANRSRLQPDQIKDSNAVAATGSGSWPMVRGDPEAVRVMASDTSDQRKTNLKAVGTGSAVSPVYLLCLSAQSWRQDRSVDLPPFDGLKHSRLLSGFVCRPRLLWSFISKERVWSS
jgi:hypothetical protein